MSTSVVHPSLLMEPLSRSEPTPDGIHGAPSTGYVGRMLDDIAKILVGLAGGGSPGHNVPRPLQIFRDKGTVVSAVRLAGGEIDGLGFDWVRGPWVVTPGRLSLRGTTISVRGVEKVHRPTTPEKRQNELSGTTSRLALLDCGTGRAEWALPRFVDEEALARVQSTGTGTAPPGA